MAFLIRSSGRNLAASMTTLAPGQRYDLVIYGATGFTGQYVVEEVARVAKLEAEKRKTPISWAIAGRSKDKLLQSLLTAKKETGINMDNVGVLLADSSNPTSLNEMASRANVLINVVGPYVKYGEPVVKACIEKGANHIDISGEPQFLESMQLKYHKLAEEGGVHIIGACGYDSIPAEMGISHMVKNFKGEINSVEMYVTTKTGGTKTCINTGTLESAVLAIASRNQIQSIRQQLFPMPLPKAKYRIEKRRVLHKNSSLHLWGLPMPTDEPVVYRTQRYKHEVLKERPIQFKQYIGVKSALQGIGFLAGVSYFVFMALFSWTRALLLRYPDTFTAGVFSSKGPNREDLKKLRFTSTLLGQGWSEKLVHGSDQHAVKPDSRIVVKISGPDPGYAATSLMMVASAMTVLREKQQLPGKGGVITPGVAFHKTDMVQRMVERGMTVDIE